MARIGIIDLQGGVVEHLAHLERLGVSAVRVKEPADLNNLAGLIIPGGESSCLTRLFRRYGLDRAIRARFAAGLKVWGTCAGAILVAKRVDGEPAHLALMDIDIRRNAFGSQLDSFDIEVEIPAVSERPLPLIFIRAPRITRLGEGVHSLLNLDCGGGKGKENAALRTYCAAAEDAQTLVTIFHPELTPNSAFHGYFCRKCGVETDKTATQKMADWKWNSWTRLAGIP
uniref:Pyridoxal 5'-phosphate synthase subunit PdxT n=1 Tax=Candidatus Kentrum sp. SD TaxID=2126332 RepID=A0A450Y6S3_9GAMM|nr:MAG: pyridoxal phosphate synthase yaaE subunit [Candidatus Kentron sp. SD]VFK41538.1 MAG: pyridoxal phosphate synthase yaaE subunit [Candidatus Kentron sp. SD]VFK78516.1 MAG: pyridoxal phosphate synthase yaaE subunit [Candidatus Kentron sp. SD]